jgi:hypothetical protein
MNFPAMPFDDNMFADFGQMNPYWDEELRNLTKKEFVDPEISKDQDHEDLQGLEGLQDLQEPSDEIVKTEDAEVVSEDLVIENIDAVQEDALVTEKAVSSTTWTWIIIVGAVAALIIVATLRSKKLRR